MSSSSTSSSSPPPNPSFSFQNLGLGYTIAITLTFLILLSTLLLTSYLCYRSRRRNNDNNFNHRIVNNNNNGIIVPRVFFVAEDDNNESSGVVGLDPSTINSYPKFQFSKNIDNNNNIDVENSQGDSYLCSICLCEYKEGEMLRMMPDCKHYFHLCCLDAWLKLNGSCPVCRNSPLPTPVSTPLAEVMPLSLYPDNRRRSSVNSSS